VTAVALLELTFCAALAQEPGADPAFSDRLLTRLGLPEIALRQPADGPVEGAPATLVAGRYLVSVESVGEVSSWVDIIQVPAGVPIEEATGQVLDTASNDFPYEGYVYGGGTYALPNQTVRFAIDLEPGQWYVAASRQAGPEGEEVMELVPLAVSGGTPTASPADIPAAVTLELRDTAFGGLDHPVPAGPQIWEVTNVGEQPRQVVYWRTAEPVTTEAFLAMMTGLMSGTPVTTGLTFERLTWVGYAAILSPGQTTWAEFDFAPGNYLAVSYVFDPSTNMPAFMLGMVQPFTVSGDDATPATNGTPSA
jgi:hypothetical protein